MPNYIYSTLAASVDYTFYKDGPLIKAGHPERRKIKERHITIKGGTGVASRSRDEHGQIITPKGVVTQVSDEELGLLKTHPTFMHHVEKGHISIESKNIDVEKATQNMTKRDVSAPKTPNDFKKAPKTGSE